MSGWSGFWIGCGLFTLGAWLIDCAKEIGRSIRYAADKRWKP
jgi:hypothetical protein